MITAGHRGTVFVPKRVAWPGPPVPTRGLRLDYQRADGETEPRNADSGPLGHRVQLPPCRRISNPRPAASLDPPSPSDAPSFPSSPHCRGLGNTSHFPAWHGHSSGRGHCPRASGCPWVPPLWPSSGPPLEPVRRAADGALPSVKETPVSLSPCRPPALRWVARPPPRTRATLGGGTCCSCSQGSSPHMQVSWAAPDEAFPQLSRVPPRPHLVVSLFGVRLPPADASL